jgi:hypothetical protein
MSVFKYEHNLYDSVLFIDKESPENSLVLLDARNLNGTMIGKFHSPIVETLVHC